jgi:chloramphenicol O-acetyltransferase
MPEAILFPIVVLKSLLEKNENGKQTMPMSIHVHHGLVDVLAFGTICRLFSIMNQ